MRRDAYRDVGGRPRLERAVEGRRPVAAMDRMSCMRRDPYKDVGGRPRRERAVEVIDVACLPRAGREQAVEEARSRPDLPAADRRGSAVCIHAGRGRAGV